MANYQKPYSIYGTPDAAMMEKIDEMFNTLFGVIAAGTGTGDVVGPSGAVAGDVCLFDATGKVISDSGKLGSSLVQGPASATDGFIALFDGITGKLLKNSTYDPTLFATTASIAIKVAHVQLTNAQIKANNTTPIQIVPAPAAGLAINPFYWVIKKVTNAAAYSANPTYNLIWHALGTSTITGITPNMNSADTRWASGAANSWGPITTSPGALALEIKATADLTLGDATNTLDAWVAYFATF